MRPLEPSHMDFVFDSLGVFTWLTLACIGTACVPGFRSMMILQIPLVVGLILAGTLAIYLPLYFGYRIEFHDSLLPALLLVDVLLIGTLLLILGLGRRALRRRTIAPTLPLAARILIVLAITFLPPVLVLKLR